MRALALAVLLAACTHPHDPDQAANRDFRCNDRAASYVVMGGLAAHEMGVQIDCRDAGPRVVQWKADQDGSRDEQTQSISVGEFDRLWEKIDGTGWLYLKDCEGTGGDSDPVYNFDVTDWNGHAEFSCQNAGELPYPYNQLVDQLDLLAAAKARHDTTTHKSPDDP